MKMIYALILFTFFAISSVSNAEAQTGLREDLTLLNRIEPLQHPDFDTAQEILDRRIIGRKNKVLGEVENVILNDNGNIVSLEVKLDRLGQQKPVMMNYNAVDAAPATNGYILGFEKAEIEELYPSMLANIETAAGGKNDDAYSLKQLPGTEIRTSQGQRVGEISNVLFGANGDRAEAFYVTIDQGKARAKSIAVPFDLLHLARSGTRLKATVEKDEALMLAEFAKTQK